MLLPQPELPAVTRGPLPGRACGTCTLCCKAVAVEELAKSIGDWCPHCVRQKGCAIYDARPESCRRFYCQWMLVGALGPEWKPDRAKFALVMTAANHLTAFVDPGFPAAWRRAPYFEQLKRWAAAGMQTGSQPNIVDVRIGPRCIVLLPDREEDIGMLGTDEEIGLTWQLSASGGGYRVEKIPRPAPQSPPSGH